MIIVTGATGRLGGAVVDRLLTRVPAERVGVSVRDLAKAKPLADRGVRVRRGDFADAASLADAFEGAEQVLLVSASAPAETAVRLHRTAIAAARDAAVSRIVYTSHMGANPASAFAPMAVHAATEQMLGASGVPFTSLRNGFYASTLLTLLGQARETGQMTAPPDGPVSWTAHADLADAAATVLTDGGPGGPTPPGPTPPLTAAAALDLTQVAAVASEVLGRAVTRVTLTDEEYRAALVADGLPESRADMLLGMFAASRAGEFAAVDPVLPRLTGHRPVSVREYLSVALR
ncbi:NmrA family NAD(P)-binding protein [Mangrovihabitans endophyticus]|uniref:NmrA family transcriptional regulator n=1 Tax=Mangrovihabitans endophyticus TaxID=1751298 RepID=A0A8J3C2U7_9ACTN|nr:NAD(P)H-binding protein [Mangrovihabitans endophyticus]GGL01137.1 NmrA family transcriptional regulator [Mangrovihabitans endophyticus]